MQDIRAKYPMYSDVPDAQLLRALHQRYYADMPETDFMGKVEFAGQADKVARMGTVDRMREGGAVAVENLARGLGQRLGMVKPEEVDAARQRDAAIMSTGAGKVGNVIGNVGVMVPTALVPGANTLAGSIGIGALLGAVQPTGTGDSIERNALYGAAGGAAGQLTGRALGAGLRGTGRAYGAIKETISDALPGGAERSAARLLLQQIPESERARVVAQMAASSERVPGSIPTAAQSAPGGGLAAVERYLSENPKTAEAFKSRYHGQVMARQAELENLLGSPQTHEANIAARAAAGARDYALAERTPVDPQTAAKLAPALADLLERPQVAAAMKRGELNALNEGKALSVADPIKIINEARRSLGDDAAVAIRAGDMAAARRAMGNREEVSNLLSQLSPTMKSANDQWATMSEPINRYELLREIGDKMQSALARRSGSATETRGAFARAMENLDDTAKTVTKNNRATGRGVLGDEAYNRLNALADDAAAAQRAIDEGATRNSITFKQLAMDRGLGLNNSLVGRAISHLPVASAVTGHPVVAAGSQALKVALERGSANRLNAMTQLLLDPVHGAQALDDLLRSNPALAATLLERLAASRPVQSLPQMIGAVGTGIANAREQ